MDVALFLEEKVDRDGGFLTVQDREFLLSRADGDIRALHKNNTRLLGKLNEEMYDGNKEERKKEQNRIRQRRHRIRNRTKDAILDFPYLMYALDDLEQTLDDENDPVDPDIAEAAAASFFKALTSIADRDQVMWSVLDMVRLDAQLEFAREHYAFADVTIDAVLNDDMPDPDDCPSLFELKRRVQDGEEIPEEAKEILSVFGLLTGEL